MFEYLSNIDYYKQCVLNNKLVHELVLHNTIEYDFQFYKTVEKLEIKL